MVQRCEVVSGSFLVNAKIFQKFDGTNFRGFCVVGLKKSDIVFLMKQKCSPFSPFSKNALTNARKQVTNGGDFFNDYFLKLLAASLLITTKCANKTSGAAKSGFANQDCR